MTHNTIRRLAVGISLTLGTGLLLTAPDPASARSPDRAHRSWIERGRSPRSQPTARRPRRSSDLRRGRGDRGSRRHRRRWSGGRWYYTPWSWQPYGYSPWGYGYFGPPYSPWGNDLDRDGFVNSVDTDIDGDGVANFYDRFDYDHRRW